MVSGAVQINNQKVIDPAQLIELKPATKIKMGKRKYIELT
ncbi:hypothetical protein HRH25_17400 [Flavisolibacter sp. BT320]|nr:hypothetical protein [Flavisolibacter longurius]